MHVINEKLSGVTTGPAHSKQNLTVVPLMLDQDIAPGYKTLDRALADGEISVKEVSESGSVPELRLLNTGDEAVLLLDGEELIGAKQNRVLNLTVLAPARSELIIPVSCVEQGRWNHSSEEFSTKGRTLYAAGRARKASQVTDSLRNVGERRSAQNEVWNDLSRKFQRMECESTTESMADLYEHYEGRVEDYHIALDTKEKVAGAVFFINGRLSGMEFFDSSHIFNELYPKINRSYALDAIDARNEEIADEALSVDGFLEAVKTAEGSSHLAIGEGEDIRISTRELTGGALVARDRLIHLCAFRHVIEEQQPDRDGSMRRSSHRMRLYTRRGPGADTVH